MWILQCNRPYGSEETLISNINYLTYLRSFIAIRWCFYYTSFITQFKKENKLVTFSSNKKPNTDQVFEIYFADNFNKNGFYI